MIETRVDDDTRAALWADAAEGAALLSTSFPIRVPEDTIQCIDDFVDRWPRSANMRQSIAREPQDLARVLGALWGQALVQAIGWTWTGLEGTVVASPGRELILDPAKFIQKCLSDPQEDFTAMLMFNMLKERPSGPGSPRDYADVTELVHRIVPRR